MYVCLYVCMYVCMYVCVYIYIYIYTHTHTHMCVYIYIHTYIRINLVHDFRHVGSIHICQYGITSTLLVRDFRHVIWDSSHISSQLSLVIEERAGVPLEPADCNHCNDYSDYYYY